MMFFLIKNSTVSILLNRYSTHLFTQSFFMKRKCTLLARPFWSFVFLMLFSMIGYAQNRTVSGKVIDPKDKTGLPGVTVHLKGTNVGTVTDQNGTFSISVPSTGSVLVFSYSGLGSQEIRVGDQTKVDVELSDKTTTMDEVVVIGYGTQRKSDLTGAVGSVKASQLQERPAASLNQALAGRIAGVQVNTNSGRPGGQTNIRIRGFSSINTTNNPLYVVDGVILPVGTQTQNSNSIDFINPNDIASVEIL
jgi:hypothetical protein